MAIYLTPGYKIHNELHEEYTICKVLGRGASTIAYLADYAAPGKMPAKRVVKEYCPAHMDIVRLEEGSLQVNAGSKQHFDEGLQKFEFGSDRQNEIRSINTLANMTPAIQSIFRANNTVYQDVMPFIGETFDNNQGLSLLERMRICLSIAKLVKRYHDAGYLCLDIKPNNIMVLDTTALSQDVVNFIDFDSIRKKNEVAFGKSLSFTEHWAPPEQTNPYKYAQISERTDIYTIGELVFWSVFNRHSTEKEHRSFSRYPFEDGSNKFTSDLMRISLQKWLSTLFANTIRSSARNRYASMDAVIECLEGATAELAKTEYICPTEVTAKSFFVGRSKEIEAIGKALENNSTVFVSGIAGIGKSELVRQYAMRAKERYNNILFWAFDGDLDHTIGNDTAVAITGLVQIPEESDAAYSHRKLRKLKELMHGGNNLIILDNLNLFVDEISQQETWNMLCSLPGKLLITTRNIERNYACISVEEISDRDLLKQIFMEYCAYVAEDEPFVERIIASVDGHTLLVELLAKQTAAKHISPCDAYEQLNIYDAQSYTGETVRIRKDDHTSSETVYAHVQKLFAQNSLSQNLTILLGQLALLPVNGYDCKKIMDFYAIESANNLNWLNERGWISIGRDTSTVTIHPMIASIAIERIQHDEELLSSLFQKCTSVVLTRNAKITSEREYIFLAEALAHAVVNRFSIRQRESAIFLIRYIERFTYYGNIKTKRELLQFALAIMCKIIPGNQYSAVREQAYYLQCMQMIAAEEYDAAIVLCHERIKEARRAKDLVFLAKWYERLIEIDNRSNYATIWGGLKNLASFLHYTLSAGKDLEKQHSAYLSESRLINELDYDYLAEFRYTFLENLWISVAAMYESFHSEKFFVDQSNTRAIPNLSRALHFREVANPDDVLLRHTQNSIEIQIDKARIAFISGDYASAEMLLQQIIALHHDNDFAETSALYRTHQFLGYIAIQNGKTLEAIVEFQKCVEMQERILGINGFAVRKELGYLYNVLGNVEASMQLNKTLIKEIRDLSPDVRGTYYADALCNYGMTLYIQGDYANANKKLYQALREYPALAAQGVFKQFGFARTIRLLAEVNIASNQITTTERRQELISDLENALDAYNKSVGPKHPETVACLELYNKYK